MTYEIYRYIFIGGAILSGVALLVSILIFVLLNIPKVISDLSGATARKAIKNIREQNEATGDKSYKVSAFNEARGKLTDKISPSGNVIQQHYAQMRLGIDTTKIETQELEFDEAANQTSVLENYNETTILDQPTAGETSVLNEVQYEMKAVDSSVVETADTFIIEKDITFIHSDEVIEMEAVV